MKKCQKCGKPLNETIGVYPAGYPMSYLCRKCYATWRAQVQSAFREPECDVFEPKPNMGITQLDLLKEKCDSLQQQINDLKKQIEGGSRVPSELLVERKDVPPPPPAIRKLKDSLWEDVK